MISSFCGKSWLSTLFHTSQTNKCLVHYEWVKSILNIWDKSLRNYVLPCKLHSLWFFFDVLLKRRFDWRVRFPPVTNTMQTTIALSGLQLPVYFAASVRILSNVSVIYWHGFRIHGFTNVKGLHTSTCIFYLVLMDGTSKGPKRFPTHTYTLITPDLITEKNKQFALANVWSLSLQWSL